MTEREDFMRQHFSDDRLPARLKPLAAAFSDLAVQVAALGEARQVDQALSQLQGAKDVAILASITAEETRVRAPG